MLTLLLALAPPVDPNGVELKWGLSPAVRQTLILLGVILLVVLAAFIWVAVRWSPGKAKRPHRPHRHHHHHHHEEPELATESAPGAEADLHEEPEAASGSEHHRKRRRQHRPRNPTLAQTGGLPPKRPTPAPLPAPPASSSASPSPAVPPPQA